MTDKSFGDYTIKNPLKNPLLSTAVTGLSISDLTQNAVLLPVAQSQELITAQELQNVTQERTLTNTDHNTLNLPSGDTNSNISVSYLSNSNHSTILSDKPNVANDRIHELHGCSLSKASAKSEDDFDFNEYFARLQGTRYVSAPINSLLKEDPNANLESSEENLEEINLNEPSKPQHDYDSQQSITADIAQNFSQLPTVLPQVASAVFSSFSSMLNLKSREQTPDDIKPMPGYQDLPLQMPDQPTVPLIGIGMAQEVKEIAPPPKEPPIIGVGSYRITTKKKAYAQIPGLSSGEYGRDTPYNPPPSMNPIGAPSYFVPAPSKCQTLPTEIHNVQHVAEQKSSTAGLHGLNINFDSNLDENKLESNYLLNPNQSNPVDSALFTKEADNLISSQSQPNGEQNLLSGSKIPSQISELEHDASAAFINSSLPQGSIIPPPPMFSNLPKADNLATAAGRSILPPSIARRISANHPIMKSHLQQNTTLSFQNIFVPTTISGNENSTFENISSLNKPPIVNIMSSADVLSSPKFSSSAFSITQPYFATNVSSQETEKPKEVLSPFVEASQGQALFSATDQFSSTTSVNTSQTHTKSYFHINPGISTDAGEAYQSGPIESNVQMHNTGTLHSENNVKQLSQPPKFSSDNMNFRMSKKRPQYYSGPISGISEISNLTKPIMTPISTSSFLGTLFTPQQQFDCSVSDENISGKTNIFPASVLQPQEQSFDFKGNVHAPQIDQTLKPFNINKLEEQTPLNVPCDANNFQENMSCQSVYNTAFDVSRDASESYEDYTQEPKTFGIIGSLKSKLSSIDINKIQNSVTTFFDPAYNDIQKEAQTQDNLSFENHHQNIVFPVAGSNDTDNFEIFVPQIEQAQSYNYSTDNQNMHFKYEERNQNPTFSSYQNQIYSSFTSPQNQTYMYPVRESQQTFNLFPYEDQVKEFNKDIFDRLSGDSELNTSDVHQETLASDKKHDVHEILTTNNTIQPNKQIFDVHCQISSLSDINLRESTIITKQNSSNICSEISYDVLNSSQNSGVQERRELQNIQNKSEALFANDDFYSPHHKITNLLDKINHGEEILMIEESISSTSEDTSKDTCKSTFHDIKEQYLEKYDSNQTKAPTKDIKDTDDITELNICETCREVNKSEIKELDGLTAQLIENITAPIQLSNAVEVPLTECDTPLEDRADFDPDKYAEISHITEETIETLIVQSATELLDDINEFTDSNVNNYGWSTDTKNTLTPRDIIDHNYSFQPDTDVVGLIGNSSLFFDNMPNNASDEIKAELKNHEDQLVILPRQMSIPTAPPEEFDESKSDEAGVLDVQSIEQDAKTDFPIFEEFIIEPSETDDDKIEFRERKRSSEDSTSEKDTFTNRVERFKKLEGTYLESKNHDALDNKTQLFDFPTTKSATIPIASYFDTGNYAAESYYRNSLTSTITLTSYTAPSERIRIPPGFEEEFQRKLSYDSSQNVGVGILHEGDKDDSQHIPETTTQTKLLESITFSIAQTVNNQQNITARLEDTDKVNDQKNITSRLEVTDEKIIRPLESLLGEKNIRILDKYKDEELLENNLQAINVHFDDSNNISCEANENKKEISIHATQIQTLTLGDGDNDKLEQASKPENTQGIILRPNQAQDVEQPQLCSIFFSSQAELSQEESTPRLFIPKNSNQFFLNDTLPLVQDVQSLPDPINFFSSDADESNNSFNRLASYFTAPPKPDHSKSFFELSQSQDHYRHRTALNSNISVGVWNVVNNDNEGLTSDNNEMSERENQPCEKNMNNMPADRYLANLDLVKDLTSYENYKPNEKIVTTVNYFTVKYDNHVLNKFPIAKSDQNKKDKVDEELFRDKEMTMDSSKCAVHADLELEETLKIKNEMQVNIIQYCVYCCNIDAGRLKDFNNVESCLSLEKFKVRKSMDGHNSESVKEKDTALDLDKRSGNKKSASVSFNNLTLEEETNDNMSTTAENRPATDYTPVKYHWFYRVDFEDKSTWRGFSAVDSAALEEAFNSPDLNENTVVPTDGGRFDVNVLSRLRVAVYWNDKPTNVRRCSWFYKGTTDVRYVPYTEEMAERLEEEYRHGITTGEWHRRLVLDDSELVVMHGPAVMVHFLQGATQDAFSAPNQATMRPRVVRRGFDDTEIEETEPSNIDHLLLMCHGVGSACDMRFRSVEEVVDDFRATSLQLIQSHYRNSYECGRVNRVEVLPISWHATLHSGETGVDNRLAQVTLESIPRLRNFTNDTVLDVLFYTSPIYSQTIVDTVCSELNRIYTLFKKRNPNFKGGVSLGGHSLGSVILYDLLCHQEPDPNTRRDSNSEKEYVSTSARLGQPNVKYPKLSFSPDSMYGLGSPIAIFECIRGIEHLGKTFALPTCKNFFNIFHPYDPIAYRIEPLINPELKNVKPFLIPHHKGRKRMHLELKDTMFRVGADLKQRLLESLKATWSSMWRTEAEPPSGQLEKVVDEELDKQNLADNSKEETQQKAEMKVTPEMLGKLNAGRRIDYVLQEAPFEMINEYLFAMSSHVCYWESEDTMLMMLREIYDGLGIQPDSTVPQQSLTVERNRTAEEQPAEAPTTSRTGYFL